MVSNNEFVSLDHLLLVLLNRVYATPPPLFLSPISNTYGRFVPDTPYT